MYMSVKWKHVLSSIYRVFEVDMCSIKYIQGLSSGYVFYQVYTGSVKWIHVLSSIYRVC